MFDTVQITSISNDNFKHNGQRFETSDLKGAGLRFSIIEDMLWIERGAMAVRCAFQGTIAIFNLDSALDPIAYRLTFSRGMVCDVRNNHADNGDELQLISRSWEGGRSQLAGFRKVAGRYADLAGANDG